jgi:hypothetical protein
MATASHSAAAMSEARSFLALIKQGKETIQGARTLIGRATPGRRRILAAFNALVGGEPKPVRKETQDALPTNVRRRGQKLPAALKNEIMDRVRAGVRFVDLRREYKISWCTMWHLKRSIGDRTGRGRKTSHA